MRVTRWVVGVRSQYRDVSKEKAALDTSADCFDFKRIGSSFLLSRNWLLGSLFINAKLNVLVSW